MEETLAEIEFLALSENRVAVLSQLAQRRHTRRELAEKIGASQATLGRILSDFEERNWVTRQDGGYVATATGQLVADGFGDLLDVLGTERELREIVPYLPTESMTFDLRKLADATVTTPTQTRPNAPVQRLQRLMRDADSVTAFSHAFNDQSLATAADRAGEQDFRAVLSRSAVEALTADDRLRDRLQSFLDAPTVTVGVYDGEIPLAVTIADDVVSLLVRDDRGVLQAAVDTDDPAIQEWAREQFEQYRDQSTALTAASLSE